MNVRTTLAAAAALAAAPSIASAYVVHASEASFNAAVGGAANVVSQNFDGFAVGTDMTGAGTFLSGVEASTNMESLEVFGPESRLFGISGASNARPDGVAYYQFDYTLPYFGVAFQIDSWNPESSAATIEVFFAGGASDSFQIFQTNPLETDPVFLGITSVDAIERVIIREAIESGSSGNEEISFGIVAVSRVPAPASAAPVALLGLAALRRRR